MDVPIPKIAAMVLLCTYGRIAHAEVVTVILQSVYDRATQRWLRVVKPWNYHRSCRMMIVYLFKMHRIQLMIKKWRERCCER